MNRWEAAESIFAPIVAAVPHGTVWSGFGSALVAAINSVPPAVVGYNVRRAFKTTHEKRDRQLQLITGDSAKPFTYRAFLSDVPRDGRPSNAATGVLWQVGVTNLKDGLCSPAVPADFDTAILQVNRLRLGKGNLAGGPQLALLRHLWAENVRAASTQSIIFGGQHHWDDSWWAETVTA